MIRHAEDVRNQMTLCERFSFSALRGQTHHTSTDNDLKVNCLACLNRLKKRNEDHLEKIDRKITEVLERMNKNKSEDSSRPLNSVERRSARHREA